MIKPSQKISSQLATALLYAAEGLPVVLLHGTKNGDCTCGVEDCKQPGEHPRTEDATTDPATIEKYLKKWPKAKIAIATGAPDIIAVKVTTLGRTLPTDEWSQRTRRWAEWEKEHGLPRTVMFYADGQDVLLFEFPHDRIRSGEFEIAEGITVSGIGEYVRLPQSCDQAAKYSFYPTCAPGELDVAPVPMWLDRIINFSALNNGDAFRRGFQITGIPDDMIGVAAGPLDKIKVELIAESFEVTGIRTPLVVRPVKDYQFELLSDPHEFAAMKLQGLDSLPCMTLTLDELDGRLWQLAQLLNQPELSPLDWAEAIMEWVRLVGEKGARVGHPVGSPQPHDKGFSRAGRVLGVSRSQVQRAEKMAGISAAAKAEIRRINLTVKRDLLKIRRLPPDEQVAMVHELAGPKPRTVPVRGAALPADSESGAAKGHEPATPRAAEPTQSKEPTQAAEATGAEDEPEDRKDDVVESPSTAPDNADGLDIPPFLIRADGEKKYQAFKNRWAEYCEAAFAALPAAMQRRFAGELAATEKEPQVHGAAEMDQAPAGDTNLRDRSYAVDPPVTCGGRTILVERRRRPGSFQAMVRARPQGDVHSDGDDASQ